MVDNHALSIASDTLTATITTLGAGLVSVRLAEGDTELLGSWLSSQGARTSGYVMSPNVGAISSDGLITFEGETYAPGKHGFIRQTEFVVKEHTATSLCLSHEHDPQVQQGIYPFAYRLDIFYAIDQEMLTTRYVVTNIDNDTLYFGGGLHPAFRWPLPGSSINRLHRLKLTAPLPNGTQIYRPSDGKIIANNCDPTPFDREGTWSLVHDDFARDAFFFVFSDNRVTQEPLSFLFEGDTDALRLEFVLDGWDGFGVWSKPGSDDAFLCIEPLVGVSFADQGSPDILAVKGLKSLQSAKSFTASMTLTVL